MERIISYFTNAYKLKTEHEQIKARHTAVMLLIIIISVLLETMFNIAIIGTDLVTLVGSLFAIAFFVFMLALLKSGRLIATGNLFIIAGFAKLLEFFPIERTNQFYLQAFLGMIVGVAIYVKAYQFFATTGMTILLSLARIPYVHMMTDQNPLVTDNYIYQVYQSTAGVAIFIVVLFFYDTVIKMEIENTKKLRILSETDILTSLKNRQQFDETISLIQDDYCLAILDIDHFKAINDQFGHQMGDVTLKEFAKKLSHDFKDASVYRWGGEEFIVLMDNADQSKKFMDQLEHFRESVANHRFTVEKQITISIGYICTKGMDRGENVLKGADQALYKAKSLGRNRLEVIGNE